MGGIAGSTTTPEMNGAPYIPAKTLEEMAAHHPEGTRHAALFRICIPLLGNGMAREAVFAQLRATFDAEKTDKEIWDVIDWSQAKNPQPSGNGNGHASYLPQRPRNGHNGNHRSPAPAPPAAPPTPEKIISGQITTEADWRERSAISLPDDFSQDAAALFSALYTPEDRINLVRAFFIADDGKPKPHGPGKTLLRDEWLGWFSKEGAPFSEAGCWIRPNPCAAVGGGKGGAISDADITDLRFVMIESDSLPMEMQLSLYAKLALPIAAIIDSAGLSAHAWLKVDAETPADYARIRKAIYDRLEPLGFDPSNKNPSRLSRLPGVKRTLGATGNGEQRLIYLNPSPKPFNEADLEDSITPIVGLIQGKDLVERIREFFKPKPFPFTIDFMKGQTLDDGFYFRDSELTVWSGVSGHGKSTMLATVMVSLIAEGIPFFVASLEIKPEKLCELMTTLCNCRPPNEAEAVEFCERFGHLFTFVDIVGGIESPDLLKKMEGSYRRFGSKHFFIDNLMRINGIDDDYPAQGVLAMNLQTFAKKTQGHIHLVAHPKKIDEEFRAKKMDVKGSSMIVNNADNVVTVRRNTEKKRLLDEDPESEKAKLLHDAEFAVEKQRETGWWGVIKLKYCRITKTYEPFLPPVKEFKKNPQEKYYKQK